MVQPDILQIDVNIEEFDNAPSVLRTLNFKVSGKPTDVLSLVTHPILDVISSTSFRAIAISGNTISLLLTEDMGTSQDHFAFIHQMTGVIGDGLNYAPNAVKIEFGRRLHEFLADMSCNEQTPAPNVDVDTRPIRIQPL